MVALLTWRDFGWRLHSRLGVDFRRKGATERRHVYSAQAIFVTLVKFDVMWEVLLGSCFTSRALHSHVASPALCFRLHMETHCRTASVHHLVHSIHGNVIATDLCSLLQITLTAVAIALAKAHSSNLPQAERLLAINLTGLGTNLIIGWGAWTVVRHRTFRTCVFQATTGLKRSECESIRLRGNAAQSGSEPPGSAALHRSTATIPKAKSLTQARLW